MQESDRQIYSFSFVFVNINYLDNFYGGRIIFGNWIKLYDQKYISDKVVGILDEMKKAIEDSNLEGFTE